MPCHFARTHGFPDSFSDHSIARRENSQGTTSTKNGKVIDSRLLLAPESILCHSLKTFLMQASPLTTCLNIVTTNVIEVVSVLSGAFARNCEYVPQVSLLVLLASRTCYRTALCLADRDPTPIPSGAAVPQSTRAGPRHLRAVQTPGSKVYPRRKPTL